MDVPILVGRTVIEDHTDLDVFLWLPGWPYIQSNFAALRDGHSSVIYVPTNGSESIDYVFVHYEQVSQMNEVSYKILTVMV